jgi:hypothetical protein
MLRLMARNLARSRASMLVKRSLLINAESGECPNQFPLKLRLNPFIIHVAADTVHLILRDGSLGRGGF